MLTVLLPSLLRLYTQPPDFLPIVSHDDFISTGAGCRLKNFLFYPLRLPILTGQFTTVYAPLCVLSDCLRLVVINMRSDRESAVTLDSGDVGFLTINILYSVEKSACCRYQGIIIMVPFIVSYMRCKL